MTRARAVYADVAITPSTGKQPDEGLPAGRQHTVLSEGSVMGGLAPHATALSATTKIRFSRPFFTRSRKLPRRCRDGRLAENQRSHRESDELQLSWIEKVHQRQRGLVLSGEGIDQHLKSIVGMLSG